MIDMKNTNEVNFKIFKAYDVRGIYPSEINEKTVYLIALGFCSYLNKYHKINYPRIVVGHDVRVSSKSLKESLIAGLKESGATIFDIGFCTTPMNYFANWQLKMDSSIMITASHNPKEYNGLKISLKKAKALAEENGVEKLKEIIEKRQFKKKTGGRVKKINILNDYLDFLAKEAGGVDFSDIKIAVDTANGAVGPVFEKLAERTGLKYFPLYFKPDGNFPNHEANPLKEESLIDIKENILNKKADVGMAFDGDGDRVVFLDAQGNLIRNDFILGIVAKYYLEKGKAKFIPADLRISHGIIKAIEKMGGIVIKTKVGYPFIRKAMRKKRAYVGGELSGHLFWKDFCYSESALLSGIRILKIMVNFGKSLKDLVSPLENYFFSPEINFETEKKEEKIAEIKEKFRAGKINELDGLTVEFKNWWFNIRPSNTEPLLRLTIEANSKELLDEKIKELSKLIEKSN